MAALVIATDTPSFEPSMTLPPFLSIAAILAAFLAAGTVKGITGMGLPTVAMGLLGTLMLPTQAAALLIIPSFVTNIWQLLAGPHIGMLVKRLWLMLIGILVGTVAAMTLMSGVATHWAVVGLGAVLTVYAISGLLSWRFSVAPRHEKRLSPLIGFVTGAITGMTGVFVIPAVPFLQALDLKREDLVQAMGLTFTVSTIALTIGLARTDNILPTDISHSLLAVIPALLGMWLGQRIRDRISAATFRRWFFICMLALGLQLLLRSVLH